MTRQSAIWTVVSLLLWLTYGSVVTSAETLTPYQEIQAQNIDEKPSLVEAYPFLIVLFVVAGLVGVVISIFALRALWRARLYDE